MLFFSVAFWYYTYEKNILTTKINKGLALGLAVGGIWFIGMIESSVMSNFTSFIAETVMGFCDTSPIVLLVVLLNKFTVSRSSSVNIETTNIDISWARKRNIISIIIFTVIFVSIRYIFYLNEFITSGYIIKSIPTFIWTICMGACIGVFYIIFKESVKGKSLLLRSVNFGFIIFGIPWFVFLAFIPMEFEGTLIDVILRCLCDGVSALLGYYLCENF